MNIHKPLLFLSEKQAWAAASMVRHGKVRAALPLLSADISVHHNLIKLCYNTMNIYTMNLLQCMAIAFQKSTAESVIGYIAQTFKHVL